MPVWRCPHCGTPQAESARCWVCRRSSTTCSTCSHFQRSLAAGLGTCGLDPRRQPLTGRELRGCWTAVEGGASPGARRPRSATSPHVDSRALPIIAFEAVADAVETDWAARATLFGDAEG